MNLKQLTSKILLDDLRNMVAKERALIKSIIEYMEEVETRKLHLEEGYSSMFAFCTEYLGYTPHEAQTRIQAMRLSRCVPEVRDQIQSGEMSLSVAAKVQSHIQRENMLKKDNKQPLLNFNDKKEIIECVKGESFRNAERILYGIFPHHVELKPERVKESSASTMRLELNLSKEMFERLVKIKNLRKSQSFEELLASLTDLAEKKWDMTRETQPNTKRPSSNRKTNTNSHAAPILRTSVVEQKTKVEARYIPAFLRRQIWQRDKGQCQYLNRTTYRICGERFGLHVDHVKPYGIGGVHSLENLRLLCSQHNQYLAEKSFPNYQQSRAALGP